MVSINLSHQTIRPLKNAVLVKNMEIGERVKKGIIILNDNGKNTGIRSRWAQVYAIGEEAQVDLEVGDWIRIEHGRWTRQFICDDNEGNKVGIQMVDINAILCKTKNNPLDD